VSRTNGSREGYIYVLVNAVVRGVTIGQTEEDPEVTVRELNTGRGESLFVLVYSREFGNVLDAEEAIQRALASKRRPEGPGQFDVSVADAVDLIRSLPGGKNDPPLALEPWRSEIEALISSGQKLQAIKRYRDETGVGLREAKDVVDRMGGSPSPGGQSVYAAVFFLMILLFLVRFLACGR
jgi:ribosomal protein L7/L12